MIPTLNLRPVEITIQDDLFEPVLISIEQIGPRSAYVAVTSIQEVEELYEACQAILEKNYEQEAINEAKQVPSVL